MADSWEDDDDEFGAVPQLNIGGAKPATTAAAAAPAPAVAAVLKPQRSWDDEDAELAAAPSAAGGAAGAPAVSVREAARIKKQQEEERKQRAIEEAQRAAAEVDPIAEKQRLEKLVRDSDAEWAEDLFGERKPTNKRELDPITAAIEPLALADGAAYVKLGTLIGGKLVTDNNPVNTLVFFQEIIKRSANLLSPDDLQKLSGQLDVIRNDKIRASKPKGKKAAAKPTKAGSLRLDRDDDYINSRGYDDDDMDGDLFG